MVKCTVLFLMLCLGGSLEKLIGSEINWQDLPGRLKVSRLEKSCGMGPDDYEEIHKATGLKTLPSDWQEFHQVFAHFMHPFGEWGRSFKSYLQRVFVPYKNWKLPEEYFPIVCTGESFYVMKNGGGIYLVTPSGDGGFSEEHTAPSLKDWLTH